MALDNTEKIDIADHMPPDDLARVTQPVAVPTIQEKASAASVSPLYLAVKRIFDFSSSLILGVVLLIPTLVLMLLIVIKDWGSPLYFQERIGKDGRVLRIAKLRSMRKHSDDLERVLSSELLEQYRREYKLKDDPRLIGYKKPGDGRKCFGAMLRRLSLDELPQILFNICLKGDMSVVGPRPILREELEKNYTPEQQKALLSVKPGLTGYWQAYARNDATYETGERQRMELYYVQNRSLSLDIRILIHTVGAVISTRGVS